MKYTAYHLSGAMKTGRFPQSKWVKIIEAGSREDALRALATLANAAQAFLEKANEYETPEL